MGDTVTGRATPAFEPPAQKSQASDALWDKEFPESSLALRALHRLRVHRWALLYRFLLEVRSLFWRIVRLQRTQLYRKSLCIGPAFEKTPDGLFQVSARTRACSRDMQSLYATRPGLTILDAELFLAGWKLGSEWDHNRADTGTRDRSAVT